VAQLEADIEAAKALGLVLVKYALETDPETGTVLKLSSRKAVHGPGLDPILSALPGRIKVKIDPDANTAYYLGIKEKPAR